MNEDLKDIEDFGDINEGTGSQTGDTDKTPKRPMVKGNETGTAEDEGEEEGGEGGGEEGGEEEGGEGGGEEGEEGGEEDVETKKPEGYTSDDEKGEKEGKEKEEEKEEEEKEEENEEEKKEDEEEQQDPIIGELCATFKKGDNESTYGIVESLISENKYLIRLKLTGIKVEMMRNEFFIIGDLVDFMYKGNVEQGNVRLFSEQEEVYTCDISNYKTKDNWGSINNNDVIKLAQPKDEEEEQKEEEETDENEKETEEQEDENLKRFESLKFFVKFFLNEEKAKDYAIYIRYYLLEDYTKFHHQSFWLLNTKIVEGLDYLCNFNPENDDLEKYIKIDQSIMSNISMLSIINKNIISKLADIKNIPLVLYEIIKNKTVGNKFTDFCCQISATSLFPKMNFYFTDRKLMLNVVDSNQNLLDLFMLNIDKSRLRIYGKVRNSESDKYIFNTYLSNLKKISYYEIFNYICYVLIWKSSLPKDVMWNGALKRFIEEIYLKNLEQYNL